MLPPPIQHEPAALAPDFPFHCGRTGMNDQPILRLHTHECLELGVCQRGSGLFVIGSNVYPFRAGTLSIVRAGVPHLARSAPGIDSEWIWYFAEHALLLGAHTSELSLVEPDLGLGAAAAATHDLAEDDPLHALLRSIAEEYETGAPFHRESVSALLWAALLRIRRFVPGSNGQPPSNEILPLRADIERIAAALNFLAQHYDEDASVEDLAQRCHVSVATLRRLFLRAVGMSPQLYRQQLRLRMVAGLLRGTNRKILDIAQSCGFQSLSNFNRTFQRAYGHSPRQERRAISGRALK